MKTIKNLYLLFSIPLILQSCSKDNIKQVVLPNKPALVKSVTWNVGVEHKMEFFYNNNRLLDSMTSGSSNLPWKYHYVLSYENKRLKSMLFDNQETTAYTYNDKNQVIKKSFINDGVETSRFVYTYNNKGKVTRFEIMTKIYGQLQTISVCNYTYSNNVLTETSSDFFDEHGVRSGGNLHKFESFYPEMIIAPQALLHALYQHQLYEIFDDVVLATITQLPKKVTGTGVPLNKTAVYDYKIASTGKKIDRFKCSTTVNGEVYDTNEAVFHY